MNIRYIQSNLQQIPQDNLIKFLYNILLQEINDIENYHTGVNYNKGDKVYLQEDNKHQIFQCIVNSSSNTFVDDEWEYIMEVFEGDINKCYNINIQEEVHMIDENTINGIYTNLDVNDTNVITVAMYKGKLRYTISHDFNINGNFISFNQPFEINDRVILEVRKRAGIKPTISVILYDLNANPYNVYINDNGIIGVEPYILTTNDKKYVELATGDRTYTLLVDGGSKPYELKAYRKIETFITGTDDVLYKVIANENDFTLEPTYRGDCFSDTKVILGLDKKFYTLSLVNGEVVASEYVDDTLNIRNFDLGVKVITQNFKNRVICIDNGEIKLLPYIDNGGYRYINFNDLSNNNIIRLTIEDNDFVMYDGLATDGYSGTRVLDYFYFFDENWNYNKMFVDNGRLLFEPCELEVIPDSRGINIMREDGELVKLTFDIDDTIYDSKYINLDNLGTFESPIEGFVVNINNVNKLITINKNGDEFIMVDTNLPFRTNHHYILSVEGDLYKLEFENDIKFVKVNKEDYNIDTVSTGVFIKSFEIINKFDIVDGVYDFKPVSTFVHRIKSLDGNSYRVNVSGNPYEEVLSFSHIDNENFDTEVGAGYLYLKDENGLSFVVNIDEMGKLNLVNIDEVNDIDYEITHLIESDLGWYNIRISNENIILDKLFDNMYENVLSYGNMVKKNFNIQGMNGRWYSLSANGLGEIVVKELDKDVNVTGLIIRSDDGYNYGLGIINGQFATYRSYVTNPNVVEELFIKDIGNGQIHSLFMTGDRLCSKTTTSSDYNESLIMYDVYRNEFKIEILNNKFRITEL